VNKFGVGQPVPRVEDPRFITGRGRFVDDFELPQQCHSVVVMSPHAHARIKRIDTAKAKAAPGVLAVLTGADVVADKLGGLAPPMPEDMGGPKGFRTLRAILEAGKVGRRSRRFRRCRDSGAGKRRRRTDRNRLRAATGRRRRRRCRQAGRGGGVGRGAE
jgi:CO/xanthine dehydrogenase Mo-binding subunit